MTSHFRKSRRKHPEKDPESNRCSTITGRLVDKKGRPLAKKYVSARIPRSESPPREDGKSRGIRDHHIRTIAADQDGRFHLDFILSGVKYKLQVESTKAGLGEIQGGMTMELGDVVFDGQKLEIGDPSLKK